MHKIMLRILQGIVSRRHEKFRARVHREWTAGGAADMRDEVRIAALPWDKAPDVIIGSEENPYLHRWHIVPRNQWPFGGLVKLARRFGDPWSRWALWLNNAFSINIYFHHFLRSDDDRALHDHPWWNFSWLLDGDYNEVQFVAKPKGVREGWEYHVPEMTRSILRKEGAFALRSAETAHRVVLLPVPTFTVEEEFRAAGNLTVKGEYSWSEKPVWTLFITGPKVRGWGFWCEKRWRHWEKFVRTGEGGGARVSRIGEGCGEDS